MIDAWESGKAGCIAPKVVSTSGRGKPSKSRAWRLKTHCSGDMLALIRWHGQTIAVPCHNWLPLNPGAFTAEAIGDYHYWVTQRLLLMNRKP
jgi:Calcium binding